VVITYYITRIDPAPVHLKSSSVTVDHRFPLRSLSSIRLQALAVSSVLITGRSKFDDLVSQRKIPRLKIGRSARYRRQDLLSFTERLAADAGGADGNWTAKSTVVHRQLM
jgi:hypothetical protein